MFDTELVQGICKDLTMVLRKSFRFSDANAVERCNEFLRESDEDRERREYLRQRKRRLASAIEELTEFGFWT
jgi:urease accessory protein UreF